MHDEGLCDKNKILLEQARQHHVGREADALSAETDDPDYYLDLHDVASDKAKALIAKKRKQICRKARYLNNKQLAEQNFLSRKVSREVRGILNQFPNIGKEIETFVQDLSVGADAW